MILTCDNELLAPAIALPLPVCNIEAEQVILGVLLTQNRALAHIPHLNANDFYEPLHQRIFIAITERITNGEGVNAITLKTLFDKDQTLCDIGGGSYLAKLVMHATTVIDVTAYAKEVQRHAVIRTLQASLQTALNKLEAGENQPHDVAATLSKELAAITDTVHGHRPMTDYDVATSIVEGFKNDTPAISTGLPRLDKAMDGGMYLGKAYGFCARKKVGKTIMASTISYNLAKSGKKHLFICGEMGPYEIHQRQIARELGVYPSAFRSGYGNSASFQTSVAEVALRSRKMILYQNAPGLTFAQLQMYVANAVNNYGISGFILDYWQLVGGKAKGQNSVEHLDAVAQWIANACRKYNIWALVTAQINQDGNTRGSEGIRLAFDQVYEIHREDRSDSRCWLEMMDTRYTGWNNIGEAPSEGIYLREKGLYFRGCGMTMNPGNADEKQDTRFKPGISGNPAGKPKGLRHKVTLAVQVLLDGEAEALTRRAVELALEGNITALRLCLERIAPARKDYPVTVSLPSIETATDAAKVMSALLASVGNGEITPSEASEVAKLVESYLKALETAELEQRIIALEQKNHS